MKTHLIVGRIFALAALSLPFIGRPEDLSSPAPNFQPTAEQTAKLRADYVRLTHEIEALGASAPAELVADVAIYAKAVDYLLRYPEQYFQPVFYTNALKLAAAGTARAQELARGAAEWPKATGFVARGYRSAVDGSVQPYAVYVPPNYRAGTPMRLDVILHGRSRTLTEISFLSSVMEGRILGSEGGRKTPPDCLKLYVFGRGNNSYRWAGESDVFEALAAVRAQYSVDPARIVLRGFSMGGTGAWHLGLHFPSRWAAVEAGAGYVETRPEVRRTVDDWWRIDSLAIHDAANCALNMTDVPFVAYVGSIDPQREENEIIRHDLTALGVDPDALPRGRFLVGEGFGHSFRPESKRQSDELLAGWLPQRRPATFQFVTYTPAYGEFWDFQVDTLEQLYRRAEIRGSWDDVTTS